MYHRKCQHKEYSVEELKKSDYSIYFETLTDSDYFPQMENGICTEECKEKMQEIYKITMEEFSKYAQNYFEDARIFEYGQNNNVLCGLPYYKNFLKASKIEVKPISVSHKKVLVNFKVGILNGKPVRLCDLPEGVKCDYDADHLPDPYVEEDSGGEPDEDFEDFGEYNKNNDNKEYEECFYEG